MFIQVHKNNAMVLINNKQVIPTNWQIWQLIKGLKNNGNEIVPSLTYKKKQTKLQCLGKDSNKDKI